MTNPIITSLTPTNSATGVALTSNIVLNFSEPVYVGSGTIEIRNNTNGGLIEPIDVTSAQVSGSGTNQITINPLSDLPAELPIYVRIDEGAFDDADGNSYAGIGDASFSFTTAEVDTTAPSLVSYELSSYDIDTSNGDYVINIQAQITDDISGVFDGTYANGSAGSTSAATWTSPGLSLIHI